MINSSHPVVFGAAAVLMAGLSILLIGGLAGLTHALFAPVTLAIMRADFQNYAISIWLLVLAAVLGCVFVFTNTLSLANDTSTATVELGHASLEGLLILAVSGAVALIYQSVRGQAGIGSADIYFFGIAGIWLPLAVFGIFLLAAASGALIATILRQMRRGRPIRAATYVPFCAFQAATLWTMVFFVY